MRYLKGRKYLDALCVYFWATTPVIISILTFATYVIIGNKLTAATVFTSMALLNMLISPLNAFPWVLNGMTEAWVSIRRIQKLIDVSQRYFCNFRFEYFGLKLLWKWWQALCGIILVWLFITHLFPLNQKTNRTKYQVAKKQHIISKILH